MSLLRSSFIVSLLSLAVSILSFFNQIIIARYFGATAHMDAFLIASSIPLFISGSIAAVFSYSLVPTLISRRADGSFSPFSGMFILCTILCVIFFFIIGSAASDAVINFFASKFSESIHKEAVDIARISWGAASITIVYSFFSCIHNARKSFYLPLFGGMLPYVGMIIIGIFFARKIGPAAFAWGLTAGTLLALILLLIPATNEMSFSTKTFKQSRAVGLYFRQVPTVMLAISCFTVYQSMDSYWAPRIGTGTLAYLGYCQRLLIAIGNLVIAGPSVVLVPRLAESHTEGRHKDFSKDLILALRMLLVCAVPTAVIASILRTPMVELLFQRGAFDTNATQGVVELLPYMLTGMIPMLCVVIMFRALYAKHAIRTAAVLGTTTVLSYFVLSGILSWILGGKGIALAYAVSWWIVFTTSCVILFRGQTPTGEASGLGLFCLRLIAASGLTGIVLVGVSSLIIAPLDEVGWLSLCVRTTGVAVTALTVYAGLTMGIFRMSEVKLLFVHLVKRSFSQKQLPQEII